MTNGIIFDWIGTLYERDKGVFPFSEKVLTALKPKYKLGLITLAPEGKEEQRGEELNSSGLLDYFDSIVIDIEKTPEQFLRCMRELGTTPETTAIVDDRVDRGIQIGNQLVCDTYWINSGDRSHILPDNTTGEPTYTIHDIRGLLTLL